MSYTPEYTKPYPDGWQDGYGLTEVNAAFLNMLDNTIIKIEEFLKNNGSGDYALLTEAGYSLGLSIDEFYVMSISLLNKAGNVLSTKQIDLPIESMVVNASYADGKVTLTLQNGNTLDVDISDMVRGLVPTTRTIAGIDLADDITREELEKALYIQRDSITTAELVLPNSFAGTLQINNIGAPVRNGTPSVDNPIDIVPAVISTITTRDDNGNTSSIKLTKAVELYGIDLAAGTSDEITPTEIKKRYALITLNGSESWKNGNDGNSVFYIEGANYNYNYERNGQCISNMFTYNADGVDNDLTCRIGNTQFIQVRYDAITSLADFKTFLANNNLVVLYELPSEVVSTLPDADQEALQSLKTFDGTTYMEFDSEAAPSVNVTYPSSGTNARLDAVETDLKELKESITDGAVMSGDLKPWLYNTSEETVIGVYNGKPLYRTTVTIPSLPNTTTMDIDCPDDIETVVSLSGYQTNPDGTVLSMDNPRFNATQTYEEAIKAGTYFVYRSGTNSIHIQANMDRSGSSGLVTIEYTKTTDAEGSGNELMPYGNYSSNSNSASSTNYSTEEQCVGTWIDGKALYQKSYTLSQGTDSSVVILDDTIKNNTHELVDLKGSWSVGSWSYASAGQTSIFKNSFNGSSSATSPDIYLSTDGLCYKSNCAGWGWVANITIQYTKSDE